MSDYLTFAGRRKTDRPMDDGEGTNVPPSRAETMLEALAGWKAGPVTPCDGGSSHEVASLHLVARCACGAAFVSTDGAIALGMAQEHEVAHNPSQAGS